MTEQEAKDLLGRYNEGNCTQNERILVDQWLLSYNDKPVNFSDQKLDEIQDRVFAKLPLAAGKTGLTLKRSLFKTYLPYAAALFLIVTAALFYFSKESGSQLQNSTYVNDIAPGKMGATLTLANGKKIKLSDAANGQLAKEAGLTISKSADGQVVYSAVPSDGISENKVNTLSTANGETYMLTLSDHTQVWLNAASSLMYSAALNERGQRRVRLSGEAYFQVAKDKTHPFIVETDQQEVEVLGTHFNVQAYPDESNIKTTLLEGSVNISSGGSSKILKPDQQSTLIGGAIKIDDVDAEDAIAWKNGLFVFEDEPLKDIMRKVARWYDLEVVYEKDVDQDKLYWGSVSRYDNVSKILKTLELTKVIHFKLEGRRLMVMR